MSKINSNSWEKPAEVDDEFLSVINYALIIAEFSDGAFDPTIGPLVRLWGINTEDARVPTKAEIAETLPLVDYRRVKVSGSSVFLEKNGMKLDFGGIAKGYVADEIASILRKKNVRRAVIDLGGNIFVFGEKSDKSLWTVGVKNPENPDGEPLLLIRTREASVVTSGKYERFFIQDGVRYHHILSAKDGFPVENGVESVTVVAKSSMVADALSTTLFALGREHGMDLLKDFDEEVGAVFVEEGGKISYTGNLEEKIVVLDGQN